MTLPEESYLLRIFIGESDRWEGQPLYEVIVKKAREKQMAGTTVLRGPMGFGANSHLHTSKILRLSADLPIIIEMVDSQENINAFLPELDVLLQDSMVTLEKVRVIHYRHKRPDRPPE